MVYIETGFVAINRGGGYDPFASYHGPTITVNGKILVRLFQSRRRPCASSTPRWSRPSRQRASNGCARRVAFAHSPVGFLLRPRRPTIADEREYVSDFTIVSSLHLCAMAVAKSSRLLWRSRAACTTTASPRTRRRLRLRVQPAPAWCRARGVSSTRSTERWRCQGSKTKDTSKPPRAFQTSRGIACESQTRERCI